MSNYLETTHDVYKEAALTPDVGLCCTTNPIWELPGLKIPRIMQEMNYGCGSTVHARDLTNIPKMLYVGVGGGMELLQFAYFNRKEKESNTASNHCNPCNNLLLLSHIQKKINSLLNLIDSFRQL